jgi:hypothetical protein
MSAKLGWLDEDKPEDSAPRNNCTEKISKRDSKSRLAAPHVQISLFTIRRSSKVDPGVRL